MAIHSGETRFSKRVAERAGEIVMAITHHSLSFEVSGDMTIPAPAWKLYVLLLHISNIKTGETFPIYIQELADKLKRTKRTVQLWLKVLIDRGLVIRVLRKSKHNPRWNQSSYFIITHTQKQNRCAGKDFTTTTQKISLGTEAQFRGNLESFKESQNLTLKRGGEPEAPKTSESCNATSNAPQDFVAACERLMETLEVKEANAVNTANSETEKKEPEKPVDKTDNYDLSGVPEAMHCVAKYLLLNTGRPALTTHEREILREILDAQHTPLRVMKEIDRQIALKKRKGGNIRQVTFNLIGAILRNQNSHEHAQIKHAANREAARTEKAARQASTQANLPKVSAQALPVEEAERIIAEHTTGEAVKKDTDTAIPVALQELYERIKKRQDELNQELFRKYPQLLCDPNDPNAECVDFTDEDFYNFTLTAEEYLRLKFPEATEEELQRRTYCSEKHLQEAFDHDFGCAMCTDPETCLNTDKRGRMVVALKDSGWGKYLCSGWSPCNGCKYPDADKDKDKPNPELEQRIKNSGLTEWQSKQTFESYDHAGAKPEVVSAKAKAILAAKNKTSLVLAGKPGTGKTHLAIAIALEAMKDGRNAIFRTVPDLLDELARADWEHTDFFMLRQKFRDVPCLVLDDLGKEKSTPKKLEYLYQIIDYRYTHGLQTIVTTNAYDMDGLVNEDNADWVEPLISRLLDKGEWVSMQEAENYRL